jgi:hypothetical protein
MENTSRNSEFKIQLSTEDINKLDEAIREMSNNSNLPEKSNEVKNKVKTTDIEKSQNTVKELRLLNACADCKNKFIPKNSMVDEKLCKLCLEK